MIWDDNMYAATVVRHVDGDTTHVAVDPGFDLEIRLTVRWAGLDAPELSTPEGKAALAWVESTMPVGSRVLLRTRKDHREKFGRYLGTFILSDGTNVNEALIAAGHAVPYGGGAR